MTPFSYRLIVEEIFGENVTLDDAVDSVRMLVDLHCDTNGTLRRFFGDPRIKRFWNRCAEICGRTGMKSMHLFIDIPISSFYLLWGPKIEAAEKFVEGLEKEATQNDCFEHSS